MGIQIQLFNLNFLLLDNSQTTLLCAALQSSALNWVLLIIVSPVFATWTKYIRDVLSTGKKLVHICCTFSHFVILTQLVIELSLVQFRGNYTRNFKLSSHYMLGQFEITRLITPRIVFHSVQLTLLVTVINTSIEEIKLTSVNITHHTCP